MTTIKLRKNSTVATVHSLPCQISYTGNCAVSDYFVIEDPSNQLENECGINGSQLTSIDQSKCM